MVLSASLRASSALLRRQFLRPSTPFGAISGARSLTASFHPQVKVLAVLYDVSSLPSKLPMAN